jgi:signal transduction histidine kinase
MARLRTIRREWLVDTAVAVVVFALTVALLAVGAFEDAEEDARKLDALGVVLAALASLPLVARRRAPLAVFALTAGGSVLLSGLGYPQGPPLGATLAIYFMAVSPDETRPPPVLTGAVVAGFFALHVAANGIAHGEWPTVALLAGALVWGGAWVVGDRVRQRRQRIADLEERALRAEREAERERRLAAAEERTRIARDLHDSAGHAINVILVQAGAARLLQERDPDRSRRALETIEEVARETVAEIDHLVGALREDGTAEQAREVEPPAGLAALDTLADRYRAGGLDVRVRFHGALRPLALAVDRASYRILQEALTNASLHGLGTAEVDVAFGPRGVEITVTNPTAVGGTQSGGHGIVGMRERAALLGGTLEAGATDGVFRVRARLPYGTET